MGAPGARKFSDLKVRTVSGVLIGAAALALLWFGGWILAVPLAGVGLLLVWEMRRMTGGDPADGPAVLGYLGVMGAILVTEASLMRFGVAALGVCALAAFALDRRRPQWIFVIGVVYAGVALAAFVGLRDDPLYGFAAALWVAITVVATDVGAYFGGRFIGGPKLTRFSPKKTWAGLLSGMALAMAVGAVFSAATTGTLIHQVCTVSALVAVVAQGGDIMESWVKRRTGVKDSSSLIPGHGGVMDRLDGVCAAALVAGLITFWRGQSVFIW